ncbi:hypothetical protein IFR05_003124 [Cadophora sp. M221]|nr:hypothetical protein IFR05_003124 [Cadophora sp. M221]
MYNLTTLLTTLLLASTALASHSARNAIRAPGDVAGTTDVWDDGGCLSKDKIPNHFCAHNFDIIEGCKIVPAGCGKSLKVTALKSGCVATLWEDAACSNLKFFQEISWENHRVGECAALGPDVKSISVVCK